MKIETGLPCGPQLRGGRRGALIQEDCFFWHYDPKGCVLIWKRGANMCRCLNMKIWYPILLVLLWDWLREAKNWFVIKPSRQRWNRHINKKLLQSHIPYMQKFTSCVWSNHVFNLHLPFYVESVRQK